MNCKIEKSSLMSFGYHGIKAYMVITFYCVLITLFFELAISYQE